MFVLYYLQDQGPLSFFNITIQTCFISHQKTKHRDYFDKLEVKFIRARTEVTFKSLMQIKQLCRAWHSPAVWQPPFSEVRCFSQSRTEITTVCFARKSLAINHYLYEITYKANPDNLIFSPTYLSYQTNQQHWFLFSKSKVLPCI